MTINYRYQVRNRSQFEKITLPVSRVRSRLSGMRETIDVDCGLNDVLFTDRDVSERTPSGNLEHDVVPIQEVHVFNLFTSSDKPKTSIFKAVIRPFNGFLIGRISDDSCLLPVGYINNSFSLQLGSVDCHNSIFSSYCLLLDNNRNVIGNLLGMHSQRLFLLERIVLFFGLSFTRLSLFFIKLFANRVCCDEILLITNSKTQMLHILFLLLLPLPFTNKK